MRKALLCLILSAFSVGVTPDAAQAFGQRLFNRNRCQPTPVAIVCPPLLTDTEAPPRPPKLGYKWVPKQVKEEVKVTVFERVIIDGRPQLVPVEKTVTRTKTVFEEVLDKSSDFGQLVGQVEEMQKALGLADPKRDPNELNTVQQRLDQIKLKLASLATLTVNAEVALPNAKTVLTVSSTARLVIGQKYRIDGEVVEVTALPPMIAAGTVEVSRGANGTTPTQHLAGALILPEPLPK